MGRRVGLCPINRTPDLYRLNIRNFKTHAHKMKIVCMFEKVQVGKEQEKAQSEKDFHSNLYVKIN